ncbi:TPM domain-containing protein [Schleiferilactobacillus shenzhenensis]|nr:TPM domain-containing protein [Schleiferilactobacillus shenzhenensis]
MPIHQSNQPKRGVPALVLILLTLILAAWFGFQAATPVHAADQVYVEDNAGVLSAQTKNYINDISNHQLTKLNGKPQYAVITEKHLPADTDIETQGADLFQKWGIGHKGWDNGLLFLIATDDRKYHLEVGYGLEPVITDSAKDDLITADVTADLKAKDYDAAITKISQRIVQKLQNAKLDTPAQVAERRQQDAAKKRFWRTVMIATAAVVGLIIIFFVLQSLLRHWQRRRRFLALTKDRYTGVLAPYFRGVDTWQAVKSAGLDRHADDDEMLEYADQNVVLNYLENQEPGIVRKGRGGKPLDYADIISDMDLAPLIPHFTMAALLTAIQEHIAQREQRRAANQQMIRQAVNQYLAEHNDLHVAAEDVANRVNRTVDLDKPSDVIARRLTPAIKEAALRENVADRYSQLADEHPEKVPDYDVFLARLNGLPDSSLERLSRVNDMEFYAILALLMSNNDHHNDDSGPFGGFWGGGSSGGSSGGGDGGSFGGGFGGGSSGGGGFSGGW